jgi:uncharacterized protein YbjT (DUF2867 family)
LIDDHASKRTSPALSKEEPMRVALTGATGFIGSHVLTELHEHGHEVVAPVRDDAAAERVAGRGASPTGRRSSAS